MDIQNDGPAPKSEISLFSFPFHIYMSEHNFFSQETGKFLMVYFSWFGGLAHLQTGKTACFVILFCLFDLDLGEQIFSDQLRFALSYTKMSLP